jgi:hypothetical protein
MCGRFARTSSQDMLAAEFGVARFVNVDLGPRYNIAPSLYVEAIVNDGGELRIGPMRWGGDDIGRERRYAGSDQRPRRNSGDPAALPRGVPASALSRGG